MCFLGLQKNLKNLNQDIKSTRQKISNFSAEQLALKKKQDARAFALLKAISQYQTSQSTANLADYPRLAAALKEKYLKKTEVK